MDKGHAGNKIKSHKKNTARKQVTKPFVITEGVVQNLEASLRNGFSITKACELAGIGRRTYYDEVERNLGFAERMERAEQFLTEKARQNVGMAVNEGDIQTSKWWLERKAKTEFATRQELTGKDGAALNEPLDESKMSQLDEILNEHHAKPDKETDQPAGGSPSESPA